MGKTSIQWTTDVWNPIRGCSRVSAGCQHCYAESIAARFSGPGLPYEGLARRRANGEPQWTGEVRVVESHMLDPFRWRKRRRIFVNSMSDLFHENVADETIDRIFAVMALAPLHTFQILTKRPQRMRAYLADRMAYVRVRAEVDEGEIAMAFFARLSRSEREQRQVQWWTNLSPPRWPLPNVWLGTSLENQAAADERIPLLLQTPAAVRFLSCEPLLAEMDLTSFLPWRIVQRPGDPVNEMVVCLPAVGGTRGVDWVIIGGESGKNARPCDVAWIRAIVAQCRTALVPVFVKQLGAVVVDDDAGQWLPDHPKTAQARRGFGFDCTDGDPYIRVLKDSHGGDPAEWPEDLRIREFPASVEVRP